MTLLNIYSESQLRLFTDRKKSIKQIEMCFEGIGKHLSFKGLRKIGKSELAKYYIATHPQQQLAYLDLENLNLTVELFPQEYVGTICYWYFNKGKGFVEEFHDPFNVMKKVNDPLVTSTITGILQELEKKNPNHKLMMEYALNFPEQLASRDNTLIGIFIDEFQLFLELSTKFEIIRLLRSIIQNQHRTRYVVLGSWLTKLDELFADASSPLFLHFTLESLPNFSRDDSFEFLIKYFNRFEITLPKEVLENMYKLCRGHPMYLKSLADRLLLLNSTGIDIDDKGVKMAFLIEIGSINGIINRHCNYILNISLVKSKAYATLKTILHILATEDENGLTLSGVSEKIKRKPNIVLKHLNRLLATDLLIKNNNNYCF
jgi:AAA+ ATPase superfamily predicted ATPase